MVIGAVAIVAVGVLALVVSEPKKGSVEWHKKEYLAAWKRINGITWHDGMDRYWAKITGTPLKTKRELVMVSGPTLPYSEALLLHHEALIRLGYLVEERFEVSNTGKKVAEKAYRLAKEAIPRDRMECTQILSWDRIRGITIIAPRQDMATWEKVLREAGVTESGR